MSEFVLENGIGFHTPCAPHFGNYVQVAELFYRSLGTALPFPHVQVLSFPFPGCVGLGTLCGSPPNCVSHGLVVCGVVFAAGIYSCAFDLNS